MTKWKIRNKILLFPDKWSKTEVVNWCNTDIKVCPNCGKVDAGLTHFSNCNLLEQQLKFESEENYYK